ncbi:MAG: zf-HC2 domain-containing protein [Syntrophomonadaceae bacterium]|jgi:hypothetical protein
MKCRHIREFFSVYLDKEANETVNDAVTAHIAVCPKCREELEQLKKIIDSLQKTESIQPPPDFSRLVMNRLREEKYGLWSSNRTKGRKRAGGFIAAVAAIALMVGIGTSSYFGEMCEKIAAAWAKKNPEKKAATNISVDDILNRLNLPDILQNNEKGEEAGSEKTDNAQESQVKVATRTVPQENEPVNSGGSETTDPVIPLEAEENPPTTPELAEENPITMTLLEAEEEPDASTEQAIEKNRLVFSQEIIVKDIPEAVVGAEKIAIDLGASCTYLSPEQLLASYPDKKYSGIIVTLDREKESSFFTQLEAMGAVTDLGEEIVDMSDEYLEIDKKLESIAGELIEISRKRDLKKEDQDRLQELNIDLQEALNHRTELDKLLTTSTIYVYFAEQY